MTRLGQRIDLLELINATTSTNQDHHRFGEIPAKILILQSLHPIGRFQLESMLQSGLRHLRIPKQAFVAGQVVVEDGSSRDSLHRLQKNQPTCLDRLSTKGGVCPWG